MSLNITDNNLNKDDITNINFYVYNLINNTFKNMNFSHKTLLIKYLVKVCELLGIYFYNKDLIKQLVINNYRDIYGILVLLLPYYDLTKSNNIFSLNELLFNENNKSKELSTTFYIDHNNFITDDSIEKYLINSILTITKSFKCLSNKLMPNWLNIFPYNIENYQISDIYINFLYLFNNKKFELYDDNNNIFKLQYETLFGTIKNFLYNDIKNIKWMIYDIIDLEDHFICPNIIIIGELLQIQNIANKPWSKLNINEKKFLELNWLEVVLKNEINILYLKALILFYLRWEKQNDKLEKIKMSKKCRKIINLNIQDDNEDKIENIFYDFTITDFTSNCIKSVLTNINFEDLYNYIYTSIQQFKYTWYGYICLDSEQNIISKQIYQQNYIPSKIVKLPSTNIADNFITNAKYFFITPKIIYNYFKSLLHHNISDQYREYAINYSWDSLILENKQKFIDRLNVNNIMDMAKWFNIRINIKRLFVNRLGSIEISNFMNAIREQFINSNIIVDVIMQCLIHNGILTYFKYNPNITDLSVIPDKNKNFYQWKKYIDLNVKIEPYIDAYHFLDNKKYKLHPNISQLIIESRWYANFGADWICQIQQFHHFIHQRIMFITGATGAGKSTVFPFMMLYATKIINFNNNGKIYCTVPRIQPGKDNSVRIAASLGIPIQEIEDKLVKSDIDYIQLKYADQDLTDDFYHPCLRLYTDGLLYNIIKQNYIFKKPNPNTKNNDDLFLKTNLFDMILIDEAHEHNTYMDMILTLSKFAIYINNQVTMGIISATMDDDESIYRKYYQYIDDNWKYPLELDYLNYSDKERGLINKNFIDRRIHMSVPFGGMNFEVKEFNNQKDSILEIVKKILVNSINGDILIFQPGSSDIIELIKEINNITPPNILAIPFYSKIDSEILENIIKKIADKNVRNSIRIPKKYSIEQINNVPPNELVPFGTYTRFIIIATTIAEASITIDTLEYVIDTGKQKVQVYNTETNQDKLRILDIGIPNQKQRKGRVGRVKPGSIFYTYDITQLSSKVIYKICIENITDKILDLLEDNTNNEILFLNQKDPYNTDDMNLVLEFIKYQYVYINNNGGYHKYHNIKSILDNTIIYPNKEGKYNYETLIDVDGKFYIIHPNQDEFQRDENLKIINYPLNFHNKVTKILKYNITTGIVDSDYNITKFGNIVIKLQQYFGSDINLELVSGLIEILRYNYNLDDNKNLIIKNYLIYIVFSTNIIDIKLEKSQIVDCDFLAKANKIPQQFYNLIDIYDINNELNVNLDNIDILIQKKILNLMDSIPISNIIKSTDNKNYKNAYKSIKLLLEKYYYLKIRLQIILKPELLEKFKKNEFIKKIKISDIKHYSIDKINVLKSLNIYEQTCFFIVCSYKNKILIKIPYTKYFISYFNRNINNLYQINHINLVSSNIYGKTKIIYFTNVDSKFNNNIIYFINLDDKNYIQNLIWIPKNVINLLITNYNININRNLILNKIEIEDINKEDAINIYKKIDYIILYNTIT